MTDDGGNISTPSSFMESHYAPKSQKEVFKSKMDSPSDVFADVDPFLELDYVAAVAGAEDSLVPVHISDGRESSAMTQSMTTSFETDLTVPQENGYSDGTSALTYSVSSGHSQLIWLKWSNYCYYADNSQTEESLSKLLHLSV